MAWSGMGYCAYQAQHYVRAVRKIRMLTDVEVGETGESLQVLVAICQRGALFQAELLQRGCQRR